MSLLNRMYRYYCNECGWSDSDKSTHSGFYDDCKIEENLAYKNIDIIEQLFLLLDVKNKISIHRNKESILRDEAYVSIYIDEDFDNCVHGLLKCNYKNPIEVLSIYKDYKNIGKYLLPLANELWICTETTNGYSLDITKIDDNYILGIPILERKKYWATRYWERLI